MVDTASLIQFSFNGIALGSIIALAGVGLTLVYGILSLPNFGHGDYLTFGAYLAFFFVSATYAGPEALWYATGLALLLLVAATWDHWRGRALAPADRGMLAAAAIALLVGVVGVVDGIDWRSGAKVLLPVSFAAATAGLLVDPERGERRLVPVLGGALGGLLAGISKWPNLTQGILDPLPPVGARALLVGGGVILGALLALLAHVLLDRGLDAALGEARAPIHSLVVGGGLTAAAGAWVSASPFVMGVVLAMAAGAAMAAAFELGLWKPLRRGRLYPGSHVLLGGFVGFVVGLMAVTAMELTAAVRTLVLLLFVALGTAGSWAWLRDRPVPKANLVTYIIASIGVAFTIRNGLAYYFSPVLRDYPLPTRTTAPVLGVVVPHYQRVTIVTTAVVLLLVWVLLKHTRFGKAVRALADNMELAQVTGIDVDRTVLKVWLLTGALTGLSGVLLAFTAGVFTPELGWRFLLLMFSAVILGGIGSVAGSLVGGFAIGLSTELSVLFLDARYKLATAFLVLIFILLVRPQGFFGVAER